MGPELHTPRLKLRSWNENDAEDGWAIYGDAEVTRFLGDGMPMASVEVVRTKIKEWVAKYSRPEFLIWGAWAVEFVETSTVIGMGLLKPTGGAPESPIEIGWHLGRRYWGNGFATEAGSAIVRYAFEDCKLEEIIALIVPENTRSAGVAKRLGLQLIDRTNRYYERECDVWKLSQVDWLKMRPVSKDAV
jgi:[ribosomal protein S5]-alanine N-acetyltransferase